MTERRGVKRAAAAALLATVALGGCPAGGGQGWVEGSLWVQNCKEGEPLERQDDFTLEPSFFAGDPLFDTTDSPEQQSSRLTIRLQQTSNVVEESNNVLLHFQDLSAAAAAFVAGNPLPITDESVDPTSTDLKPLLRMQLQLYVICPENRALMVGTPQLVEEQPGAAERCLLPVPDGTTPLPACPVLDDADRAELDQVCAAEDFDDSSPRATIERILGRDAAPACLYPCQLGGLERGDAAPAAFDVDFGDMVAGLFYARIVDSRAVRLGECAAAEGRLVGMFRFKVARSRVAQPFP